ncbi:hypothetical protein NP493_288g02032 [Ridgeia piscesae]|uniref:Uncharacterized protein n=1 Tax=Ridgeia piscesae TaxID=27915 RepID=A0AAD9UC83_RIDPI|nr:hypothetical protein NP493_288g02032 [Ridgeia piscesae]
MHTLNIYIIHKSLYIYGSCAHVRFVLFNRMPRHWIVVSGRRYSSSMFDHVYCMRGCPSQVSKQSLVGSPHRAAFCRLLSATFTCFVCSQVETFGDRGGT